MPIHWATFNLAPHAWAEPGEWTRDAAEEAEQAAAFPRPGEPFEPAGRAAHGALVAAAVRAARPPLARARGPGPTPVPLGELDLAGER